MANNPYVNKVQFGNQTLIDLSSDTITADKLMQGYTAHDRTGAVITGTATSTPYYMWQDSSRNVHISASEHGGYQINVSSVEEHHSYTTIYEATISNWTRLNDHCYEYEVSSGIPLVSNGIYRVTYDNTVYNVTRDTSNNWIGSNVYNWDGYAPLEYPFQITDMTDMAYIDVTTSGTHTLLVEYLEN